jgi:hypothetical protein
LIRTIEDLMEKGSRDEAEEKQEGATTPAASAASSNGNGQKPVSKTGSPQRKPRAQKKAVKSDAGGEIASPRQQAGAGGPKPEMQKQYRKLEQMEKITTKRKKTSDIPDGVRPSSQPAVQELVAPHEWDMMLHAFEENGVTPTSQPRPAPGQIEIDSEDLWEKLSSTRWLKAHKPGASSRSSTSASPDDPSNKTTVANR